MSVRYSYLENAAEIRKFRGAHICQWRADMGHGEIGNLNERLSPAP